MTDIETRLTEIEAREKAATPGPWRTHYNEFYPDIVCDHEDWRHQSVADCLNSKHVFDKDGNDCDYAEYNAEFIASSRSDIPWLIEQVRRLSSELEFFANNAKNACDCREAAHAETVRRLEAEIAALKAERAGIERRTIERCAVVADGYHQKMRSLHPDELARKEYERGAVDCSICAANAIRNLSRADVS